MDKKKIEKLLKIQEEIHNLRLLIVELDDIKLKRDRMFIKILKGLSKIASIDLIKTLEADKNAFYEKGMFWTSEKSLEWLIMWFDKLSADNK